MKGANLIAKLLNAIFHPPDGISDIDHRNLIIDAVTGLHTYVQGLESKLGLNHQNGIPLKPVLQVNVGDLERYIEKFIGRRIYVVPGMKYDLPTMTGESKFSVFWDVQKPEKPPIIIPDDRDNVDLQDAIDFACWHGYLPEGSYLFYQSW